MMRTALIAVDWGTTSFRAFALSGAICGEETIIARTQAPAGIMQVADGAFETVLEEQLQRLDARADVPVIMSGMITSRQGWIEVDRETLRHLRYPEIFGVGDILGVPKGKTAASVKAQSPVATANIVDFLAERELSASYNGYTSCPMITAIGTALLIEFDYENRVIPTFPTIDPFSESWAAWVIEDQMLRPLYYTMLRGYA